MIKERKMADIVVSKMHVMNLCMKTITEVQKHEEEQGELWALVLNIKSVLYV